MGGEVGADRINMVIWIVLYKGTATKIASICCKLVSVSLADFPV